MRTACKYLIYLIICSLSSVANYCHIVILILFPIVFLRIKEIAFTQNFSIKKISDNYYGACKHFLCNIVSRVKTSPHDKTFHHRDAIQKTGQTHKVLITKKSWQKVSSTNQRLISFQVYFSVTVIAFTRWRLAWSVFIHQVFEEFLVSAYFN